MTLIKKTLFPKNLSNYSVLVNDTDPNSQYFKISELPDTFTGGKNAFLIAGSEQLVSDTKIQIELKDSAGNIIYHEPGEGMVSSSINGTSFVTEYYEGVSKVVAVYVYPDTAYGACTLTILGELSSYTAENGIVNPVPIDWENKYNVKWEKQINVNPSLPNVTKIRFYQRPKPNITEILSPIYRIESGSKVNSGISQSFADIKLSQLETFAGDVKRVKVFRTSQGDISDYDLIQDILVESKELLTSYGLSGSVVGETGILTSETLQNYWNTGSLKAELTSSRVESGVKLSGSGYFTYTSSLDIKSANTYELNLDAFYSSSTSSNLGIYLSYVSQSTTFTSSIATLIGTQPTKNLLDTVIPFQIDRNYPSASLYFSQSQGEWHLGNISLKLSQDTAFSPDEISFVTTMPTVIGNETYNFKFEFYDVNNNYVPVFVTGSGTFTGGINVNNTFLLVSASTSQSLAALSAVSSSISGTVNANSSSAFTTITNVSSSLSGSIISLSGSVSGSITSLSSSVSGSITTLSGSVSGSIYSLSGSVSTSLANVSSSISSSLSTANSQSIFTTLSASAYLDKFIFTDANGRLRRPPTASAAGLYTGDDHLGFFSESVWKTYMDDQGDFYLTSSAAGGGFLAWSSTQGRLQILGDINIQGGNAATTASLNSATSSLLNSINSATQSLSSSLYNSIFTNENGQINKPPNVTVSSPSGLYLGSTFMGYYNGTDWKTYMANNGNFFLSGAGTDSLSWSSGVLTINGSINLTGGNAQTQLSAVGTATGSLQSQLGTVGTATSSLQNQLTGVGTSTGSLQSQLTTVGTATSSLQSSINTANDKIFTDALGRITKTPTTGSTSGLYLGIANLGYYSGTDWKTYMDNTGLFYLTGSANGNALLWDGSNLIIKGNISVGSVVPNSVVSGLGSLALSSSVAATTQVTGLGGLATKSSVGASEIDTGAVTEAKIGTGAVSNAKIAADAVTEGKIATDAVTSGKISANAIVAGKIAADAVTANKISAGAVTAVKIDAGAVTADKISAGAVTADKISASAVTADKISAGAVTAAKISAAAVTADKILVTDLQAIGATIGGWSIDTTKIYNSNVQIDNTNSRIDFLSGGVVKTRIKSGNADIGYVTTQTMTLNSGIETPTTALGDFNVAPVEANTTVNSEAGTSTFTVPSSANGYKASVSIPYPTLSIIGRVSAIKGASSTWNYSAYASIEYTITKNGNAFANGTKALVSYTDDNLTESDTINFNGFNAGTILIPNIGTVNTSDSIVVSAYLSVNVSGRLNPDAENGTYAGSITTRVYGWNLGSGTCTFQAVANRAEYATNGLQVGSAEGTYASVGDAAGAGYVGLFAGNVLVSGILTAGSISTSDKRTKTNVKIIKNGIDTIKKLKPVSFDWLQHKTGNFEFEKGYGFIADDIENVLPELVYTKRGFVYDDTKHLEYTSFHAIAIKAIQELTEKVERLEAKLSGSI